MRGNDAINHTARSTKSCFSSRFHVLLCGKSSIRIQVHPTIGLNPARPTRFFPLSRLVIPNEATYLLCRLLCRAVVPKMAHPGATIICPTFHVPNLQVGGQLRT